MIIKSLNIIVIIICIFLVIIGVNNTSSALDDIQDLQKSETQYIEHIGDIDEDRYAKQYANVNVEKNNKYNKDNILGVFLSKTAFPIYLGIGLFIVLLATNKFLNSLR